MATSITITITPTRALTVEGRLVAGETAEVTIGGATPTALYLVAPDQIVIAACEAFTPMGQGGGGTGFLQLATEQVAALFANTPAGRMVAVWALVNNADGVAGAGWIPVVSAPMPDELVDLDIDFYLRASQVGAGLAIVDGKLVCTISPVAPVAPSTDASAAGKPADAKATGDQLAAKLSRAEAEAGWFTDWVCDPATLGGLPISLAWTGTAWRPVTEGGQAGDDKGDAASASLTWVGGPGGEWIGDDPLVATRRRVCAPVPTKPEDIGAQPALTAQQLANIAAVPSKAAAADLRYVLGAALTPDAGGMVVLADRTDNYVVINETLLDPLVFHFPAAVTGRVRDFLVRLELAANVAAPEIALPVGVVAENAGGAIPTIATTTTSGETATTLLYFSEQPGGHFLLKGEEMKAVASNE